jgi:hypothetical protein
MPPSSTGTSNTWLSGTGRETYGPAAVAEHADAQSIHTSAPENLIIRFTARTVPNLVKLV